MWARIRAEYFEGRTCRELAERYGVEERTVSRRALSEGWTRRVHDDWEKRAALMNASPLLASAVEARKMEVNQLLMAPRGDALLRFAFRRATEAAVLGRPAEAANWLRMVDQLRRNSEVLLQLETLFDSADVVRARFAETLAEADRMGAFADDEDEEEDAAPMAAKAAKADDSRP